MTDVVGLEVEAFDGIAGRSRREGIGPGVELLPARGDMRPALHDAIDAMRRDLRLMCDLVVAAIGQCGRALGGESELCDAVLEGDAAVNALHHRVRHSVLHILTRQAPLARDLRRVMAGLLIAEELERMGDHCVSIAKQCAHLAIAPLAVRDELRRMAQLCVEQVSAMGDAIDAGDAAGARAVASRDDILDRAYHRIIDGLLEGDGTSAAPAVVLVAHHLERIGDRVTNIAEHLIFAVDGDVVELG